MTSLSSLLSSRYGATEAKRLPQSMPALNATLELMLSHRSIRGFLPQKLQEGTVELLIAAAQSAPSSSNLEIWSAVSIEDKERIARINQNVIQQPHVEEAPLMLVFLADLSIIKDLAIENQREESGLDYFDSFLMAALDAGLAAQNVVTAAESLGLGTVYGGALRNDCAYVIKELELPDYVFPIFSMSIGVPDPARLPEIKPRLPQRVILHRERYSKENRKDGIESYDAVMREYTKSYREGGVSWIRQVLSRLKSGEALHGRDQLKQWIESQKILMK